MKSILYFFIRLCCQLGIVSPIQLAQLRYWFRLHRWPDFEHPKDWNEKINWLKFYGDTSLWPLLADKLAVREYVKAKGCEDCLVQLYGHWDRPEDIEWDELPNQFVLKTNNGCGDVVICKDKSQLNKKQVIRHFQKVLRHPYGIETAEPHYLKIKPCIIAEELLDASTQPDHHNLSLVDYKVLCINGEPQYISCSSNRIGPHISYITLYDTQWNTYDEGLQYTHFFTRPPVDVPKPACLDRLLAIVARLSEGIPQVRIDMYIVGNNIYFGEYTLTPNGGYVNQLSQALVNQLGKMCHLPCDE